ncbi:MAG: hypothetical protein ACP5TZ_06350 [Nitrososphaeria archaeon]
MYARISSNVFRSIVWWLIKIVASYFLGNDCQYIIIYILIKKKLVVRKATEIAARICVYNLRQLVYLKYTRGIDPSMKWLPTIRPVILGYLTH